MTFESIRNQKLKYHEYIRYIKCGRILIKENDINVLRIHGEKGTRKENERQKNLEIISR